MRILEMMGFDVRTSSDASPKPPYANEGVIRVWSSPKPHCVNEGVLCITLPLDVQGGIERGSESTVRFGSNSTPHLDSDFRRNDEVVQSNRRGIRVTRSCVVS